MSTVFITGITGYIGSRLARALIQDHTVCGLVRDPINRIYLQKDQENEIYLFPYQGGRSIKVALEACHPDIVYHLAAYYVPTHDMDSVDKLMESNLRLGVELLEAMASTGCRQLVYATTVSAYTVGGQYEPSTLYAATKQAFSDLVTYYTRHDLLRAAAVAIGDSYGPGDQRPKVLNLIRQSVLEGSPLQLTSGRQLYDAVYIDDIVRGLVCAANSLEPGSAHQFFQLHNENSLPLRETVELMLTVNGVHFQPDWGTRSDPEHQSATAKRIYPDPPGWQPVVSLPEGLHRFWTNS